MTAIDRAAVVQRQVELLEKLSDELAKFPTVETVEQIQKNAETIVLLLNNQ